MTTTATDIYTLYLTEQYADGTYLVPGWYFETSETDVPQGPYQTQSAAELAAQLYTPEE